MDCHSCIPLPVLSKKEQCNHGTEVSFSRMKWDSFFESIHQIVMRYSQEHVRLEALSIINMIIIRSNAYFEREKFGQTRVFESVSQLLRKEAGLLVEKQAVHFLYLLLNCPKLLAMFCSGCKDWEETARAENVGPQNVSPFRAILEGLADCVGCCGNGVQDLELRRNALVVLAFLASSGKSGFEVLLTQTISKRTNFLVLLLRVLGSEVDLDAAGLAESPEIFKQRTLLMREALILLNRLVSNPAYFTTVLGVLTSSRDVVSLTIDVANRLSWKGKRVWESDNITTQIRESEIIDLARVFKKRVFSYLGDQVS